MPDYVSAFNPVSPVQGVPTPDAAGAGAAAASGMREIAGKGLQRVQQRERIDAERSMQTQREMGANRRQQMDSMMKLQAQQAKQEHESKLQTEMLTSLKERDESSREATQKHEQNMSAAEAKLQSARDRASKVGNSFNVKYQRIMTQAQARDSWNKTLGMATVMEQYLRGSPITKLLAQKGTAQVTASSGDVRPAGQPSKSWVAAVASAKEQGLNWQEQKSFNPFQGASVISMLETPEGTALIGAKGAEGLVDYLDKAGQKVGANALAAFLEDFDGQEDPTPQTLKKALPGALAHNTAEFLTQVSEELAAARGSNQMTPEADKAVMAAQTSVNNALTRYYRTMGVVNEVEEIKSQDASSGLLDSIIELSGGKDYIRRSSDLTRKQFEWLRTARLEDIASVNEQYRMKMDQAAIKGYQATMAGDAAGSEAADREIERLFAEHQKVYGALALPEPQMEPEITAPVPVSPAYPTDF